MEMYGNDASVIAQGDEAKWALAEGGRTPAEAEMRKQAPPDTWCSFSPTQKSSFGPEDSGSDGVTTSVCRLCPLEHVCGRLNPKP